MRALHRAAIVGLSALLVFCCLFELAPALYSTVEEGFQYAIIILGRYLDEHRVGSFDIPYPFDGQLYFYSRLGMDIIFSILQPFATLHPIAATRIVMLTALVVYVVGTIEFTSAQFELRRWFSAAAVVLAPVIFASAYFLNDSLPSAACIAVAFALSSRFPRRIGALAAGVLLGMGACLRIDALFVLPFFALQLLMQDRPLVRRTVDGLALLGLALLLPSALDAAYGTSLIKVLAYGRNSIALFDRTGVIRHGVEMGVSAFQLADFILGGVGLLVLAKRRDWRRLVLSLAPAGVYVGVYLHSLYEARYLLPVVPLLLGPVALGLAAVHKQLLEGRGLSLAAVLAATALLWFAPLHAQQSEGLRPYSGQLRAALITREWLKTLSSDSQRSIRQIEAAATADPSLHIVSDDWNADRLTHFALMRAGYRPAPSPEDGVCRFSHERFVKGARAVLHVRPHLPFLGGGERLSWDDVIEPCWSKWGGRPIRVLFVSAEPYAPNRFAGTQALTPVPPAFTKPFGQPLWAPFVSAMRTDQVFNALPDRHPSAHDIARYKAALGPTTPLLGTR